MVFDTSRQDSDTKAESTECAHHKLEYPSEGSELGTRVN